MRCEYLNLRWAEDVGDVDRHLRPSAKRAMGLPGLVMFVSGLGCFQASFPNAWEMTFDALGSGDGHCSTSC